MSIQDAGDALGFDEMAVCPFIEDDLEALVTEVPSDLLRWLAQIASAEATRRGI